MTECQTVHHLMRISKSRTGTDPLLQSIATNVLDIIEDIKKSKISKESIDYLVELLPSVYEEDGTGLLMRHLSTSKPDCSICEAIEARILGGTSSETA